MGFVVKLLLLSEFTDHFKSQMVNFPSQRLRPFIAISYHHHSLSCLCMKPLLLCDCPDPFKSWVGDPNRCQQAVVGVDQALTKAGSFSFCSEKNSTLPPRFGTVCCTPWTASPCTLARLSELPQTPAFKMTDVHFHLHKCHISVSAFRCRRKIGSEENRFTRQGLVRLFLPRALPWALVVCLFVWLFVYLFVCK